MPGTDRTMFMRNKSKDNLYAGMIMSRLYKEKLKHKTENRLTASESVLRAACFYICNHQAELMRLTGQVDRKTIQSLSQYFLARILDLLDCWFNCTCSFDSDVRIATDLRYEYITGGGDTVKFAISDSPECRLGLNTCLGMQSAAASPILYINFSISPAIWSTMVRYPVSLLILPEMLDMIVPIHTPYKINFEILEKYRCSALAGQSAARDRNELLPRLDINFSLA